MSGQGDKIDPMDDDNVNVDDEEDDEDGEDIYEVDHIMDMKMVKGVRHFYVRWKGYDESEDSWEPEENVAGAKEIVENFMASYKPKSKKQDRPSKTPSTSKPAGRKRRSRSREPSKEDEPGEKSESEDDDYGKSKRKKKRGEKESTSYGSQPKTESFTPVSALNIAVKRKMNSNLRWLEDDSDGNASDSETKLPILTPTQLKPLEDHPPPPDLSLGESSTEKTKEKKKKKKSKKHSKDKERSGSPVENTRRSTNNPPPSDTAKVTVLGVYRPDDSTKNEYRFIVRNHSTNQDTIMTLAETFLADGWQLCRYLASRIHFRSNGQYQVEVNGETNT